MPELVAETPAVRPARPFLSLVTATYQRKAELEALLTSLSEQVPPLADEIEIVLCDNASSDGTQDVVRRFVESRSDLAVRFHRQSENVGVDRNILDALELARGEYVWFIADDDEIAPGKLERVVAFARTHAFPIAIVRSNNVGEWDSFARTGADEPSWIDPADPRWSGLLFATPFLASIVFRRDGIHEHLAVARSLIGTCYAAWALTLGILSGAREVPYIDEICVLGNKNFNGQARFPDFDAMVKGRIRTWDVAARGRVRDSLRPLMIRHALSAWRSAAADTLRVGPRNTLVSEYAASFHVLGPAMWRGLPWVLTAMILPRRVRRALDGLRVRARSGTHDAAALA